MSCSIYDVVCAFNGFIDWIWGWISWIIDIIIIPINFIFDIISLVYAVINATIALVATVTSFINGFLGDFFAINSTMTVIFSLVTMAIAIVIILRVYNVIADMELAGFKLPKIR